MCVYVCGGGEGGFEGNGLGVGRDGWMGYVPNMANMINEFTASEAQIRAFSLRLSLLVSLSLSPCLLPFPVSGL